MAEIIEFENALKGCSLAFNSMKSKIETIESRLNRLDGELHDINSETNDLSSARSNISKCLIEIDRTYEHFRCSDEILESLSMHLDYEEEKFKNNDSNHFNDNKIKKLFGNRNNSYDKTNNTDDDDDDDDDDEL